MEVIKVKIRYTLQFFFDKGEDASQAAEIVNGVYGADTYNFVFADSIQVILMQENVDNVKNVDKITKIFEVDRQVSIRSIAQELKIYGRSLAVLSHLRKIKRKSNGFLFPQTNVIFVYIVPYVHFWFNNPVSLC